MAIKGTEKSEKAEKSDANNVQHVVPAATQTSSVDALIHGIVNPEIREQALAKVREKIASAKRDLARWEDTERSLTGGVVAPQPSAKKTAAKKSANGAPKKAASASSKDKDATAAAIRKFLKGRDYTSGAEIREGVGFDDIKGGLAALISAGEAENNGMRGLGAKYRLVARAD